MPHRLQSAGTHNAGPAVRNVEEQDVFPDWRTNNGKIEICVAIPILNHSLARHKFGLQFIALPDSSIHNHFQPHSFNLVTIFSTTLPAVLFEITSIFTSNNSYANTITIFAS